MIHFASVVLGFEILALSWNSNVLSRERIPWPKAHIHRVRNERDLWWAVAYGLEAGQQSVVGQTV